MVIGVPVSPKEIEDHAQGGPYSSKWMLYLRMRGFDITVQKEGRKVVSYTLVSEPKNAAEFREIRKPAPKQPKQKAVKVAKPKAVKQAKTADPKDKNMAALKAALAKRKAAEAEFKALEEVGLGIPTSTNVDGDFDSYDGDVRDLIV